MRITTGYRNAAFVTLAAALAFATSASAQTPAPSAAQPDPKAGGAAIGQAWSPTISQPAPANSSGYVLDARQTEALASVNKYFTDLKQLKGSFLQTNADGKRLRGKFSIKQPGRFRFDYGSGSKLVIISDGKYLSIRDLDINTDDRIDLDRTAFRILLRKDVDILRDANVLEVQDVGDLIVVALQDKSPDAPGRIRLFLSKEPTLELKEWVTTDAQGIDTKTEISGLDRAEAIDDKSFDLSSTAIRRVGK